jgi:hypothetical protein
VPLFFNNNVNIAGIIYDTHRIRKVMFGADTVWELGGDAPLPPLDWNVHSLITDTLLQSYRNSANTTLYPMSITSVVKYDDLFGRLTFTNGGIYNVHSADHQLFSHSVGGTIFYPVRFTDGVPENNLLFLTFCKEVLVFQALHGLLRARIDDTSQTVKVPHQIVKKPVPEGGELDLTEFAGFLTFLQKVDLPLDPYEEIFDINSIDPAADYWQDFEIVSSGTPVSSSDYWQLFDVNAVNTETDYTQDFNIAAAYPEILTPGDYWQLFAVNSVNTATDYVQDFSIAASYPEGLTVNDYWQLFAVNAVNTATDYAQDFNIAAKYPDGITAADYWRLFVVNSVNTAMDYAQDFVIASTSSVNDYWQDFALDAILTAGYTQTFDIQSIQAASYVQDFTIASIHAGNYTKDFTVQTQYPMMYLQLAAKLPGSSTWSVTGTDEHSHLAFDVMDIAGAKYSLQADIFYTNGVMEEDSSNVTWTVEDPITSPNFDPVTKTVTIPADGAVTITCRSTLEPSRYLYCSFFAGYEPYTLTQGE